MVSRVISVDLRGQAIALYSLVNSETVRLTNASFIMHADYLPPTRAACLNSPLILE